MSRFARRRKTAAAAKHGIYYFRSFSSEVITEGGNQGPDAVCVLEFGSVIHGDCLKDALWVMGDNLLEGVNHSGGSLCSHFPDQFKAGLALCKSQDRFTLAAGLTNNAIHFPVTKSCTGINDSWTAFNADAFRGTGSTDFLIRTLLFGGLPVSRSPGYLKIQALGYPFDPAIITEPHLLQCLWRKGEFQLIVPVYEAGSDPFRALNTTETGRANPRRLHKGPNILRQPFSRASSYAVPQHWGRKSFRWIDMIPALIPPFPGEIFEKASQRPLSSIPPHTLPERSTQIAIQAHLKRISLNILLTSRLFPCIIQPNMANAMTGKTLLRASQRAAGCCEAVCGQIIYWPLSSPLNVSSSGTVGATGFPHRYQRGGIHSR